MSSLFQMIQTIRNKGFTPDITAQLSREELKLLSTIVSEYDATGESPTLDQLWSGDFERKPVSIDEFLDNDFYLGKVGASIYSTWRNDLRHVLSPYENINEWIISGSIGAGKTYSAVIALLYKIYYLQCLRDPQKFYGLGAGSPIIFGLFNVFKYLAQSTSYQYLLTWIRDLSPFFRSLRMTGDKKKESDKAVLDLPKGVGIALGSTAINALGQNLLGGLADEAEFGKQHSLTHQERSQIADLYFAVKNRMNSRFMQAGGINPGLLILVSSARDEEGFLAKHTKATQHEATTRVSSYALWEVKKHIYEKSPRFKVVVGDKLNRSYILEPGSEEPRPNAKVVEVPVEFRSTFVYDIDGSLRDIAGVTTYGNRLFLERRDLLLQSIEESRPRRHPFTKDVLEVSIDQPEGIEDYFDAAQAIEIADRTNKLYRPKFFPSAERFIHVDLAKNKDYLGFAMACIAEERLVTRYNHEGLPVRVRDYVPFVDMMIRIKPTQGSQIDFAKVRRFIFFLISTCRYRVKGVSYDSWQSTDSIQIFTKEGIESKEYSLDRKPGPYRMFRSVIMEKRLDAYYYEPFVSEITKLEDHTDGEKGKFDHADGQFKDVSDAVCGAVINALTAKGVTITGNVADEILQRAGEYQKQMPHENKVEDLLKGAWVQRQPGNQNPLEMLFKKR